MGEACREVRGSRGEHERRDARGEGSERKSSMERRERGGLCEGKSLHTVAED